MCIHGNKGCEFDVVPDPEFIEFASSKIQYIGGEIHSECLREMSKIMFSMEQEAIQGPAVVHKSEALCLIHTNLWLEAVYLCA